MGIVTARQLNVIVPPPLTFAWLIAASSADSVQAIRLDCALHNARRTRQAGAEPYH